MPTIYQLSFNTSGCKAEATLNGFPVLRTRTDADGMASMPINQLLVGPGNRLVITVEEATPDARLQGSIAVAGQGEIVEVGPTGGDISLAGGGPQVLEKTFDAPLAPFASVLQHGAPLSADAALDFAISLRDSLRAGDRTVVRGLLQPKVEGYAEAFAMPVSAMAEQLEPLLPILFGSDLAFERGDLQALGHCSDVIWELRRVDGRPLLLAEDGDGGTFSFEVYVADLGEGIRIVR